MAKFSSWIEVAEWVGCEAEHLADLRRYAYEYTVQDRHGQERVIEIDLVEARPTINAIREAVKQKRQAEAAKAELEAEMQEIDEGDWRLYRNGRSRVEYDPDDDPSEPVARWRPPWRGPGL